MMTPKEKAEELYNRFDMIIYTAHDYKSQIFACMDYFIESMINEHYFDEDDERLLFWESVKVCKEEMIK
jgi:hypothetical protein